MPSVFPHMFDDNTYSRTVAARLSVDRASSNETDILLSDISGFDIRAYSPDALVNTNTNIIVDSSDPGFVAGTAANLGSFVDLGLGGGQLSGFPQTNPADPTAYEYKDFDMVALGSDNARVYDTWTPFYESDGINQDGDIVSGNPLIDEGTNGEDTDGANGVDDAGERETLPPYAFPIRGIEVRFRSVEKKTKQVNQTTIVHSFVPE